MLPHPLPPTGLEEGCVSVDAARDKLGFGQVGRGVEKPPAEGFVLEDHPIDTPRPVKVIVIGAGLSGINAGILIPAKVPHVELVIYEKNAGVGGTWLENIYPGVRCDVPAHVYQSTFHPNKNWSEHYAQGDEIRRYWEGMAEDFGVYKYLRFNSRVQKAEWDDEKQKWRVQVEGPKAGETLEDEGDVLISAVGHFNAWKLPEYPGIEDFEGHLRHSSDWDPGFRWEGKKVALIGNGASGIQLLPQLQKTAIHVDHYARNPTWIASSFGGEGRKLEPFTQEELDSFEDPEKYHAFRKNLESQFFRLFGSIFVGSKLNTDLQRSIEQQTAERLEDKPSLLEDITPDFPPTCRRLTPGPGYLEALTKDNVSYIRTPISRFTKTGIITADGAEREVDAVICSTGAHVSLAPTFQLISRGVDLKEAWQPTGSIGYPRTYLGVAVPNFPNFFLIDGPSATGYAGTVPHSLENQIVYVTKVLRKLSREGIASTEPTEKATSDFVAYADAFWPQTVLSAGCSSWYNGGIKGGRVHGLWPGSALHSTRARREPRWEDYTYKYTSASGNRFAYFGNGWTRREQEEEADLTVYLRKPGEVDLRTYHEGWWEV